MVGACADWFAVTAIFRRPLGLPIPHTALIPRKKERIGRSLKEFVARTSCARRSSASGCSTPSRPGGPPSGHSCPATPSGSSTRSPRSR